MRKETLTPEERKIRLRESHTGSNCVIVRRDVFEVIQPKNNELINVMDFSFS